jgi:hypothetical protein
MKQTLLIIGLILSLTGFSQGVVYEVDYPDTARYTGEAPDGVLEIDGDVVYAERYDLKYSTYSDLFINEINGYNAKIVGFPVMKFRYTGANGTDLQYIDSSHVFDIHNTGELTISAWVKPVGGNYVLGKYTSSTVIGKYAISLVSSKLRAAVQDAAGYKYVNALSTFNSSLWYHLIFTVKENDSLKFYINNIRQGASKVTTFDTLNKVFEFYVGTANNAAGSGTETPFQGYISDVRIYSTVLSSENRTKLYNNQSIGNELAWWPIEDINSLTYHYDVSGNNRHLLKIGSFVSGTGDWAYDTIRTNTYNINYGYSIYKNLPGLGNIYMPYQASGIPLSRTTNITSGYYHVSDVPPSTTHFNLAPSIIDFNPTESTDSKLNIFDRSSYTIQDSASRASANYNSKHPFRYNSSEININILKEYLKEDYQWMIIPSVKNNSVALGNRYYLDELMTFNNNLTTNQKLTYLSYTGDLNKFYTIDYYWSTNQICAQRGNKILSTNDAGILYLSLDCGSTNTSSLDVSSDLTTVTFAHIFSNGNILFCGQQKAYYSTDNLATYHEATVIDIDGNPFVPIANGVFRTIGANHVNINREILTWGCYATETNTAYTNINVWYSTDNGLTIKSAYKFMESEPILNTHHIHGINWNPNDSSFWVTTGDDTYLGKDACHWLRGEYNINNDIWEWDSIRSGDINSHQMSVGIAWKDNYMYWGVDKIGIINGIWRVDTAYVDDITHYEFIDNRMGITSFNYDYISEMIATVGNLAMMSLDGITFDKYTLTGGPTINPSYGYILNNKDKNSNGYYCLDIMTNTETYPNFTTGPCLMIRFKKNE